MNHTTSFPAHFQNVTYSTTDVMENATTGINTTVTGNLLVSNVNDKEVGRMINIICRPILVLLGK